MFPPNRATVLLFSIGAVLVGRPGQCQARGRYTASADLEVGCEPTNEQSSLRARVRVAPHRVYARRLARSRRSWRADERSARAAQRCLHAAALTAPPRDGWRTNGGNLYNQRYSPLTRIDRGNVASSKACGART